MFEQMQKSRPRLRSCDPVRRRRSQIVRSGLRRSRCRRSAADSAAAARRSHAADRDRDRPEGARRPAGAAGQRDDRAARDALERRT